VEINKKHLLAAGGCALLPSGGLGASYFIFGWRWKGCILGILFSFFLAVIILSVYLWLNQRKDKSLIQ